MFPCFPDKSLGKGYLYDGCGSRASPKRTRYFWLMPAAPVAAGVIALFVITQPPGLPRRPRGLGTAGSFAVLAGTTVTNTGPSLISGNLGVSPGTAVTGFPPGTVTGTMHTADAAAEDAQADLTTAYNDAAGQPHPPPSAPSRRRPDPRARCVQRLVLARRHRFADPGRAGRPERGLHLPGRFTLITDTGSTRPPHPRRPGLQRLLASGQFRDTRNTVPPSRATSWP